MGWVDEEFRDREQVSQEQGASAPESPNVKAAERQAWSELVKGLRRDVEEFKKLGGTADLDESGDLQCRVSNSSARTAVRLTADIEAHAIRYVYEPEGGQTAVPEGGVLSLRQGPRRYNLYSADQRLSSEEARRLILEPLLFPRAPLQGLEPTGT